ncbi:hypothetical protein GWI33_023185 [Rhynchophorus ferrugineus]|uniref:RING-type domain-containing protein n=1 Tax=Rhynchophorus ferrugineus TaxID=354439 RepID=A0A834IMA5_RHYFE|nr:hypothetical protein GWI33_023185 [Rhynchophorus ferrugineus]
MDKTLRLLLKYPLIKENKSNENTISYEGKIFVVNTDYNVSIERSASNTLHLKYLKTVDPIILKEFKDLFVDDPFTDIIELLDKISSHLASKQPVITNKNQCDIYLKVLNEYSEFTKFFLNLHTCSLKEDLSEIFASVLDEKSREHKVIIFVDFSGQSKNLFVLKEFDLPKESQTKFKASDSLTALFDEFLAQLEILQPYFDILDEFDHYCTILDPEKPNRKDSYRRIWLGDNASCIITVSPYSIFRMPDIRFLGPDRLVNPFIQSLNDNISEWNCENGIYQGILKLLGIDDFPKRPYDVKPVDVLVEHGECIICFSLRLNDKLPEIICTNQSCEKPYHNQCLYDWLIALNAKRVFNNITGNCPNCEKTISCPVLG